MVRPSLRRWTRESSPRGGLLGTTPRSRS
jgi:hypothetical protein